MKYLFYILAAVLLVCLLICAAPFAALYFIVDRICSLFETIFARPGDDLDDETIPVYTKEPDVWDNFLQIGLKTLKDKNNASN